ncbi:cyclodeaminase/cyclohydrolase family protein [Caldinitratiruptor microaerophilus]|uniref:Cyclic nucleotide-binding domain-containing protein n=1 Tax=Caldinitratiruptor microaerophilus TaxID=671077 RepID=A0AA35CKF6_9FIRM|nr:formimidoyltransferase-cyclodeaminase [Caldinitratiruptor microaerophilus]BDG58960.1 hypothetical protein caldi_00500 [Caldinitratiruptor microaerophilus]
MVEVVQCVPNFSEGRRQEVVDALVAACRGPGVREQVLENRVTEAFLAATGQAGTGAGGAGEASAPSFAHMALGAFIDALAAGTAAPGGGTASALAGAMAAGLIAMVARLSQGKRFAEVAGEMARVAREADVRRSRLLDLADADSAAFDRVMAAYKLPKDTDAEKAARAAAIAGALMGAARVPLDVARTAIELVPLAAAVAERGNPASASDAAVAAHLIQTAVLGALLNVEINAGSLVRLGVPEAARAAEEFRGAAADLRGRLQGTLPPVLAAAEAHIRGPEAPAGR